MTASSSYSPHADQRSDDTIEISKLVLGPDIESGLAVGRTDGSLCIIQLGDEYMAKFKNVPKMKWVPASSQGDDINQFAEVDYSLEAAKLSTELVREESMSDDDSFKYLQGKGAMSKFDVVHQFGAHDGPVTSILFESPVTLYTAGGSKYEVKKWVRPKLKPKYREQSEFKCAKVLYNHSDSVTSLIEWYIPTIKKDVLISASFDGSFTMIDKESGKMVREAVIVQDEFGNPNPITCSDIDEREGVIIFGLLSGHVAVYILQDLVVAEGDSSDDATPVLYFSAHAKGNINGVSAIRCLTNGFYDDDSTSPSMYSTQVLTGGIDGVVKRWDLIGRRKHQQNPLDDVDSKNEPSINIKYWPLVESQRCKHGVHVLKGHESAITALEGDKTKFISASADGSARIWEPSSSSGECLYIMEGFTDVTSICARDNLFITDGMKGYVCVHDFDVVDRTGKRDGNDHVDLDF